MKAGRALMLIIILVLSGGQGIDSAFSRGKVEKVKVTQKVKEFFGSEILQILENPDKVIAYQLNPLMKKESINVPMLYKFQIIKEGPLLNKSQVEFLQNILLNEKTYDFRYSKRGFIFPEYGFRFLKGSKEVIVFICFSRNELMFYHNKKELIEDFDSALKKMKKLIKKLF